MDKSKLKITELPALSVASENGFIPIAQVKEDNETYKVTMKGIRETVLFENAFTSVNDALLVTVKDDTFFVYTDESKEYVQGWINSGSGAIALLDSNSEQLTYGTYALLKKALKDKGAVVQWVYNGGVADGGEQTFTVPLTGKISVQEVYVDGLRQFKDVGFEVDADNGMVFTLAAPVKKGQTVVALCSGKDDLDKLNQSLVALYSSPAGASNIGVQGGGTVEGAIVETKERVKTLNYGVKSFSDLRATMPFFEGQTIFLKSWDGTNFGGSGTFIGHIGTADDDGGIIAAGNGFYWQRVLENKRILPEFFGASPTYDSTSDTGPDSTDAFKKAINAAMRLGINRIEVSASPRYIGYLITDEVNLSGDNIYSRFDGVMLVGKNQKESKIYFRPSTDDSICFSTRGGSGVWSGRGLVNLAIENTSATRYKGSLVVNEGTCWFIVESCYLGRARYGIRNINGFSQDSTDGDSGKLFCEFMKYNNNRWDKNVFNITFEVTTGTDSFHGVNLSGQVQVYDGDGTGIGISVIGSSTVPASAYNNFWDLHFWGNKTGIKTTAIKLSNGYVHNTGGRLTGEGLLYLGEDGNANNYLNFDGYFRTVTSILFDITSESQDKFGKFKFNNICSAQFNAMTNTILKDFTARPYIDNGDDNAKQYPTTSIFRVIKPNYQGIAFSCFLNSSSTDNGGSFWFGQTEYGKGPSDFIPKARISGDWSNIKTYAGSLAINVSTNDVNSGAGIRFYPGYTAPYVTDVQTLGTGGYKYKGLLLTNWSIDSNGIIPTTTAAYNLGSSSKTVNNIYSQNAVTVVSDRRLKDEIAPIDDAVLDAWGSVNFSQWKLNSAIAEKGKDKARVHFGIVAQDIKEAFEAAGLDATDYGILIYDSWEAQDAVLDEEGNVIEPAKEAGDIWMVRMEECLVLEAAYQRREIEAQKAQLQSLMDALGHS